MSNTPGNDQYVPFGLIAFGPTPFGPTTVGLIASVLNPFGITNVCVTCRLPPIYISGVLAVISSEHKPFRGWACI